MDLDHPHNHIVILKTDGKLELYRFSKWDSVCYSLCKVIQECVLGKHVKILPVESKVVQICIAQVKQFLHFSVFLQIEQS